MTNYEYYEDKIKPIVNLGLTFAVNTTTGGITLCDCTPCGECLFNSSCDEEKYKWAYEEHSDSMVNWTEVPVDSRIYVKGCEKDDWQTRHFAKYSDGKIYAWQGGQTSFTSNEGEYVCWDFAKLAE